MIPKSYSTDFSELRLLGLMHIIQVRIYYQDFA